jgi:hypothetical protein
MNKECRYTILSINSENFVDFKSWLEDISQVLPKS